MCGPCHPIVQKFPSPKFSAFFDTRSLAPSLFFWLVDFEKKLKKSQHGCVSKGFFFRKYCVFLPKEKVNKQIQLQKFLALTGKYVF